MVIYTLEYQHQSVTSFKGTESRMQNQLYFHITKVIIFKVKIHTFISCIRLQHFQYI